jgi:hypothetical protein
MSDSESSIPFGKALVAVLVAGGGWMFLRNYEIQGLDGIEVKPRSAATTSNADGRLDDFFANRSQVSGTSTPLSDAYVGVLSGEQGVPSTFASSRGSTTTVSDESDRGNGSAAAQSATRVDANRAIRVGSWALAGFGRDKFAKSKSMDLMARIVRQFDVIAIQQITSQERDLLPRVIEIINRTGRRYDFLLGPTVGPGGGVSSDLSEQYAFLFDSESIETDRGQLYTVADPGDKISYDPLVGWFRVTGVPKERAWTFTLVNFRVDSSRATQEVPLVGNLMAAVAADGRGEDDLLLAGMLHADDRQLMNYLGGDASQAVVRSTPTDIFARYQLSNLISPRKTTTEYLGRGGVIDFLRLYNLSSAECEELTPHLPVYGEFTPTEGN